MDNIREILAAFAIEPGDYSFQNNKHGLINKSYKVTDATGQGCYFLQKIDHGVFKNVEGLMNNIAVTVAHLGNKKTIPYLELIPLQNQERYLYTDGASYWRLYRYVMGKTYLRAENPGLAAEAGKAFGQFLGALADLDSIKLIETIPRFHDIFLRHEQFIAAKAGASEERLVQAEESIKIVEGEINRLKDYYEELIQVATKRITHNDAKLSNLLFDKDNKAKVVVDYDTLMPGYQALDYGDAVRTICSSTVEDSDDLANTFYNEMLIQVFTENFVTSLGPVLSEQERALLPMAACYMPFIMGLRMLTDYLNNDIYYSTEYPEHNLVRARNQFTVYMNGLKLQPQINNIVKNLS
jgi:Ser/Thr protein kinase RdoA (MazF antagonist)